MIEKNKPNTTQLRKNKILIENSFNIIEEIKKFVKQECEKSSSKYGSEPYEFHFIPMVYYAEKLVDRLKGDKEVVLVSAWLHDIGSIIYGRENHHITGVEIAEKKLKELNYPEEKINLVKKCIFNHRGSLKLKRNSVEERIIAEADAMSHFDNISGIFKAAFVYENLNQKQATKSVRKKLINKYNQLSEESKKLIKPKFEASMLLLS